MKHSATSPLAKSLLESARMDRPSEAQRSRIWEQVALAPQLSVVAPLASQAGQAGNAARTSIAPAKAVGQTLLGGLSGGKMLIAGALAGSVLTVGVGMFLMRTRSPEAARHEVSSVSAATPNVSPLARTRTEAEEAPNAAAPAAITGMTELDDPTTPSASAPIARAQQGDVGRDVGRARKTSPAATAQASEDVLMFEAALVSQARTAIVQGRAGAALDVLDLAARESSHNLEPEELSLRIRALHLLGRDTEANHVEELLKTKYPDNFLSR